MYTSFRSLWLASALLASAAACSDSSDPDSEFVAPTTADEVATVYDGLGTCNNSSVLRELEPRAERRATSLWTTPTDAPAEPVRLRGANGTWSTAIAVNELSRAGIGGTIHARSSNDPCLAVERLFSPHTPEGTNRSEYLHALLYLGEGQHPYTAFPAGGVETMRADAPLAIKSYLDAVSAVREPIDDGAVFKDAVSQQLPMYVSCTKPFQIETTTVVVTDTDVLNLDPALCDGGTRGSDGKVTYRCVGERAVNPDSNTCKFVVDGTSLVTDGQVHPVAFGGTIITIGSGESLTYDVRVDRFSALP